VLTTEQALTVTSRLYSRLAARRPEIRELEDYFEGQHSLRFASQEWRADHERRYQGFSDNWCGVVGTAAAEVTEVIGFRLGDDLETLDQAERLLRDDWSRSELASKSTAGWQTTAVAKRSFALVWGDRDGVPVVTWEHPSQVIVDVDPETGDARYALKAWLEDDVEYATLYEPDAVWKWTATGVGAQLAARLGQGGFVIPTSVGGRGWVPREVTGEPWPLRNPIGEVPVVEFPNRPRLGKGPISDIDGTKSMQDAINTMWAYLMVAADFASMPQRVVMGQAPPKIPILDESGQKVGEQVVDLEDLRNGRMLWLTGKDSKVGEFSPASSDFFLNVVNTLARHISQQTKTPIYLIHGELGNVNGETMAALNEPRNGKVRESHKHLSASIRRLYRLMALVRGDAAVAQACRTATVDWQNPATVSDAQRSDAAIKDTQVGLPLPVILADRYGKSQAEIDRIMRLVDEQSARDVASILRDVRVPGEAPGEQPPAEVPAQVP
jgi:hypothetical protein